MSFQNYFKPREQGNIKGHRSLNILIVDDDPLFGFVFDKQIRIINKNHKIVVKNNARSAINFLKEEEPLPDILFVDVHMPGMDGIEFLDYLESVQSPVLKLSEIVVMTTSIFKSDEERAKQKACVNQFKIKPYNGEELEDFLQTIQARSKFGKAYQL